MYRAMPSVEQRAKDLAQLAFQLDVLEGTIAGPYATGPEITSAVRMHAMCSAMCMVIDGSSTVTPMCAMHIGMGHIPIPMFDPHSLLRMPVGWDNIPHHGVL